MGPGTETRASAREPRQSSEPRAWPEVLAIWALLVAVALEIVVTYWRIPPHELYHVHHHGIANGLSRAATFLNVPAALLVLRIPVRRRPLRVAATAYASFLLAWGIANVVNDAWLEQVVKRGWTRHEVPGVLSLHWNWTWAAVVVGAAAVFAYSSRTRFSIHSDI